MRRLRSDQKIINWSSSRAATYILFVVFRHNFLFVVFTPQTASCRPEHWVSSPMKTMHYQCNCNKQC